MKKVISFLSTLILSSTSLLGVSACKARCNNQENQEVKVEFDLISKIEIKKTSDDKFSIRFYKENTNTKDTIPNNFWHLSDNGKYIAEFNNISDEAKKSIISTLKIKDNDYYPDFTTLKDSNLKDVNLAYKINNNQKQLTHFNAKLVYNTSTLARQTTTIEKESNQDIKTEFDLISKIEIEKTSDDKFSIRFYKENTNTKDTIPNNFWHLSDNGKYIAEFNNISDEAKKSIISTLKIKDNDYYPDFTTLKDSNLKDVNLTYKINNNQKQLTHFNAQLVTYSPILARQITTIEKESNQDIKTEFDLISKIEIEKTSDDKFSIRFYKENTNTKDTIPNNFWHLSDNGKYIAEFNNISDEAKKSIINTLKIKDNDYYPDFTTLKDSNLKDVNLTYKINNNQKQLTHFNAKLVTYSPILARQTTTIEKESNQDIKTEFDLISKIEIEKTSDDKFSIRFYKENTNTKDTISNNFWHLSDNGKYIAEFNNISDEAKKSIISTLKIKEDMYYPNASLALSEGWNLKDVNLAYKINNNQKQLTHFNAKLVYNTSTLARQTTTIEKESNQDIKTEFDLISKIEIEKTSDDKFSIRFYKENTNTKDTIPNNFWHLSDNGKYIAEFNNISDEAKKSIINTLKIKEDMYYPNAALALSEGWNLKDVNLTYKINNNQKQLTHFNAKLVIDISVLLKKANVSIEKEINQEWISEPNSNPKFTEKWFTFIKTNQEFINELKNSFINEVKNQLNLDITTSDFDWEIQQYPSNVKTDFINKVYYFTILINVNGKNQLRNQYIYEANIYSDYYTVSIFINKN